MRALVVRDGNGVRGRKCSSAPSPIAQHRRRSADRSAEISDCSQGIGLRTAELLLPNSFECLASSGLENRERDSRLVSLPQRSSWSLEPYLE